MARLRVSLLVAVLASTLSCKGGGVSNADLNTGQTVIELTDAVTALQQRDAEMQAQIDSLQRTVLHQDTLITRLSASAGLPVPTSGGMP